jgi:hypothetical protein
MEAKDLDPLVVIARLRPHSLRVILAPPREAARVARAPFRVDAHHLRDRVHNLDSDVPVQAAWEALREPIGLGRLGLRGMCVARLWGAFVSRPDEERGGTISGSAKCVAVEESLVDAGLN